MEDGGADRVKLQMVSRSASGRSPHMFAKIMKSHRKQLIAFAILFVGLSGIGWFHLNRNAIAGSSEIESLQKIVSKYHASESVEGVIFEPLSSEAGPNGGIQKTYRALRSSREIATVTINSFLGLGWQESRYERRIENHLE